MPRLADTVRNHFAQRQDIVDGGIGALAVVEAVGHSLAERRADSHRVGDAGDAGCLFAVPDAKSDSDRQVRVTTQGGRQPKRWSGGLPHGCR